MRWRAGDEQNRVQLAPITRIVEYGDIEGSDRLTVS